jgi:hypothetical protein
MSNSKQLALGLALVVALALAAQRAAPGTTHRPDEIVTALASDRDDGRLPTTGPTNPSGY